MMTMGSTAGTPAPTNEVYAVLAAYIDQPAVQRIFQGVTGAMIAGVTHIHLLFQSFGGAVGDGVCLYNFFRSLPIRLTLYNAGSVASIGVIAYLGAKERKISTHATFMVHRTQASPQHATAERLQAIAHSLTLDDERTEAILRQHITMGDDKWAAHKVSDLWFSAQDAVDCKLATVVGEFAPPIGTKVFNV